MKPYIYIAVRSDLSRPQQIVQASHAAIEAARNFVDRDHEHPSVIVLNMNNEKALEKFIKNCPYRLMEFREPNMENQLTAVATEAIVGEGRNHFRKYQLIK